MLKYSEIIGFLNELFDQKDLFSSEPDEIVKNTELFSSLGKLSLMLEPSDVINAWWGNATRWSWIYTKAIIDDENIPHNPAKRFALIPLFLDYIHDKKGEYYELHVRDAGTWFTVRVYRGNEEARKIYFDIVNESRKILPELSTQVVREHLPYRFRSGVIKRKYLSEPMMKEEEAKKIMEAYEKRNMEEIYPISLREYLRVAGYCIRAVHPEDSGLSDIELYKMNADFRHGGMLDLPMDDKKAFVEWYESDGYDGSHPFEIIAGFSSLGIHLFPPDKERKRFLLSIGSNLEWSSDYVKCVKELLKNNVPFDAPNLKDALDFLTGEIYVGVNKMENGFKIHCYGNESFVDYVKWDPLKPPILKSK